MNKDGIAFIGHIEKDEDAGESVTQLPSVRPVAHGSVCNRRDEWGSRRLQYDLRCGDVDTDDSAPGRDGGQTEHTLLILHHHRSAVI